ncbi:hypothetical protein MC885_009150 [Smutsia gigantea]|nr:hypothetical protein MC885_009150 [Smutsia gigantea]
MIRLNRLSETVINSPFPLQGPGKMKTEELRNEHHILSLLDPLKRSDLPSEEVDQELIEDGQWEDILKQPCPSQYSTIKEEDLVVWVDPLDGTKEYTEASPLKMHLETNDEKQKLREHRNEAKAGPDAVLGRTIWGVLGLGAFGFQLKEVPAGRHIITTTRSHSNKLVTDCVTAMNPDDMLRVGGAGNKV